MPPSGEALKSEITRLRKEIKRLRRLLARETAGLDALLRRRGFRIYKREPAEDLLIPSVKYVPAYYRMLHKYSFRLFLRDVIKHQKRFDLADVARYAAPATTKNYIEHLLSMKLVGKKAAGYALAKGPVTSFGPTLEWYVAEVFRREFSSEAVWGVKFRRPKVGGDYDVIAKLGAELAYVEVKSSPPKQIYDSEVAAFLDRVGDLAPSIAIFFMDTELRMKDKLVPMFEAELKRRYVNPPEVLRMERELFQIGDRVFIINAKESAIQNIEKVMSWFYQKTAGPDAIVNELSTPLLYFNSCT